MTIYINGTSGISGVDGSAGTPAIQGTDADTGVLFPAADTWAVAVGGVEKIRVQTSGMSGCITASTAVASTSGTAIDFTGIPSWVKRITVMFNAVSVSGTSSLLIQLGDSGGVENSGYISYSAASFTAGVTESSTAGFNIKSGYSANTDTFNGSMIVTLCTGTTWVSGSFGGAGSSNVRSIAGGGSKTLSDTLDRIRITTVNGTDTFDAGTINILYEG